MYRDMPFRRIPVCSCVHSIFCACTFAVRSTHRVVCFVGVVCRCVGIVGVVAGRIGVCVGVVGILVGRVGVIGVFFLTGSDIILSSLFLVIFGKRGFLECLAGGVVEIDRTVFLRNDGVGHRNDNLIGKGVKRRPIFHTVAVEHELDELFAVKTCKAGYFR